MSKYTYELNLGWINSDEVSGTNSDGETVPPLYIDGKCWYTREGIPVLIPDAYLETAPENEKHLYQPLPIGTIAIKYPYNSGERVIIG